MYKDINEEVKDLNSKVLVLPFNSGIYGYLKKKITCSSFLTLYQVTAGLTLGGK